MTERMTNTEHGENKNVKKMEWKLENHRRYPELNLSTWPKEKTAVIR